VEWAIASHGMYESALVFISISKWKNLYIVGCVQCDIWAITAYFLLPELNTTMKINILLLYLWLLGITKVRIRFWNYLFKAGKIISCIQNLIVPIVLSGQPKYFPYLDYSMITESQ